MVVPPRSPHAAGTDVDGHNVAVIGEPFLAEGAFALLGDDLSVEEFPHLAVRTEFPISPGDVVGFQCAEHPSGAGAFLGVFVRLAGADGEGGARHGNCRQLRLTRCWPTAACLRIDLGSIGAHFVPRL